MCARTFWQPAAAVGLGVSRSDTTSAARLHASAAPFSLSLPVHLRLLRALPSCLAGGVACSSPKSSTGWLATRSGRAVRSLPCGIDAHFGLRVGQSKHFWYRSAVEAHHSRAQGQARGQQAAIKGAG